MRKFSIDCTGSINLIVEAKTKEEAEDIAKYAYDVNDKVRLDSFDVLTVWEEETEEITERGA